MDVKIKLLSPQAALPRYATSGSAGCDLTACLEAPVEIRPGDLVNVPTGIALELPPDVGAFLFARSGLGVKHGICLSNGVGVVDSDYRGEIRVGLCNVGHTPYIIRPGDRICQMVFLPVVQAGFTAVEELGDTERGGGGFGSTGS